MFGASPDTRFVHSLYYFMANIPRHGSLCYNCMNRLFIIESFKWIFKKKQIVIFIIGKIRKKLFYGHVNILKEKKKNQFLLFMTDDNIEVRDVLGLGFS